jgi:hypothetical protein
VHLFAYPLLGPSGPAPKAPRAEAPHRLTFGGGAAELATVHVFA